MGNPWLTVHNLLILRLDNIGDVLMTAPALRALRTALPEARLTLLASPAGAQAAPLLPWLDQTLAWRTLWQDLGRLAFDPAREWELVRLLSRGRFDAAIILTSFNQSPHPAALICYLAGIPLRAGQSKEKGGELLTFELHSAPDELHQAERNLRLLEALGFPVSHRELDIAIPSLAHQRMTHLLIRVGLDPGVPYLLWAPWASCQARTYFPERGALAARELADHTGWPVIVTGIEKDRPRTLPLLDILGRHGIDFLGATEVPELAALIAHARLVLTNNTSLLHLADALHIPSVITYSGTDYESQWRPRTAPASLLRCPTDCSPCYAFTCPRNRECLDFSPREITTAALALLKP